MAEDRSRLALVETIWDMSLSKATWMNRMAERFGACVSGLAAPTTFHAVVDDRGMHLISSGAPEGSTHIETVVHSVRNSPRALVAHSRKLGDTGLLAFRHGDFPDTGDPVDTQPEIAQFGGRDVFTVGARNGAGETVFMTGCLPQLRGLRRNERRAWEQVSAHLAGALWLREAGQALAERCADVTLDADGLVLFPDPAVTVTEEQLDSFGEHLAQRLRHGASTDSLVDQSWERALFNGEWSFVDREDRDGELHFRAVRNPQEGVAMRRLTARERELVTFVCSDQPMKSLASECGVSVSAFSRRVNAALRKMGLSSRSELILMLAALRLLGLITHPDDRSGTDPSESSRTVRIVWQVGRTLARFSLTPAECSIVRALVVGETDRQIAQTRASSSRTVANQIQSIYRKLGLSARHELACWLVRQLEADISH